MNFKLIEAENVDLIAPFPVKEIKRLVGWMHCYKTMIGADGSPQTDDEMANYLQGVIQTFPTYGVIDKANMLGYKHDAPLIGYFQLEPVSPTNIYLHITSNRKAWGSGLMDEAGQKIIQEIFDSCPTVLRISASILNGNKPAKNIAKRAGFKQDGLFKDCVTQNGVPKSIAHFGLTRNEWNAQCQASLVAAKPQSLTTTVNSLEQTPDQV